MQWQGDAFTVIANAVVCRRKQTLGLEQIDVAVQLY